MLKREQLHNYQTSMVDRLVNQPKNYLALSMGMGKSVTTLTAIQDLLDQFTIVKTLIIAPLRVATTVWHTEIQNWEHLNLTFSIVTGTEKNRLSALMKSADIYIINRENVKWIVDYYGKKWPFDNIVIDEASSFKTNKSQRWKALRKTLPYVDRMTLLSGTPSPQGLLDLWAQIYLLDTGERLGRTMTAYKNKYFESDYMGFKYTAKTGSDEKIHNIIDDIMVSMSSADYLELPKLINITVEVQIPNLKKYKELEKEMIAEIKGEEISSFNAAALAQKLTQYAQGAIYTDDQGSWIEIHDSKIKALKEIVEDNPDEHILVAYNYKTDLIRLKKAFPDAKVVNDENISLWNKGEINMLLAHPSSCAYGINLQKNPKGNTCVWFGLTWSLELRQQFDARLYRQGKTRPVTIINLVASDTIDSRIQKAIESKCSVQDALMFAIKYY